MFSIAPEYLPLAVGALTLALGAWRGWLIYGHERAKQRAESLFRNHSEAVIVLSPNGSIEQVNQSFIALTGWRDKDVHGRFLTEFIEGEDRPKLIGALAGAAQGRTSTLETKFITEHDGMCETEFTVMPLTVADRVTGAYVVGRSIRPRKELERKLERQALHDQLTGLPNRTLFNDRLEHALARAQRSRGRLALLYLDLDRFKYVNDTAGHPAGDALLKIVAKRLDALRGSDTVARLGGDEFAVLIEDVHAEREPLALANRIVHSLSEPVVLSEGEFVAGASVGVVVCEPSASVSPGEIVRQADIAMYDAKRQGGGRFALYSPYIDTLNETPIQLVEDLQRAIDREELVVHYHPIVDLGERRIVGAEALVRWEHPVHGLLSPASFLPVAERTDMIVSVDRWVLSRACREIGALIRTRQLPPDFVLNVNWSAFHIEQHEAVDAVADTLLAEQFPAQRLRFELAESIALDETATAQQLHDLGVQVAIDDFGMGYSAIEYLLTSPLNAIKLDRTFVRAMRGDRTSLALVRTTVMLADVLGLDVIVEGIEDKEQARQLQSFGCRLVQGYHFSRPLALEELRERIDARIVPDWAWSGHGDRPETGPAERVEGATKSEATGESSDGEPERAAAEATA